MIAVDHEAVLLRYKYSTGLQILEELGGCGDTVVEWRHRRRPD
jgi:hypothetical protein